jgi:hypothetical protein
MLQKFKITSYAIMVALSAVLVLPVNAAELQLPSHIAVHVVNTIKKKGLTRKKLDHLRAKKATRDAQECADQLGDYFEFAIRDLVEAMQHHDSRWADLDVAKAEAWGGPKETNGITRMLENTNKVTQEKGKLILWKRAV